MVRARLALAAALPLISFAGTALADPETDQLREQLRATVLQLRQLQDQQAAAPAPAAAPPPDAAAKAKLAALQAQLRAARRDAGKTTQLQADLDKLKAENTALKAQATETAAQLDNVKAAYGQSVDTDRTLASERDRLKADLTRMTTLATVCQAKNDRLYKFTESVLDYYGKRTVLGVLPRGEPFLGLERVRLENLAQDREDTARADRCDPRLDAKAPPAKAAGG